MQIIQRLLVLGAQLELCGAWDFTALEIGSVREVAACCPAS